MAEYCGRTIKAIGLDLGHTLMWYDGVPMSWQRQYPDALRHVCRELGISATEEQLAEGCDRLGRYNTRLQPRQEEVPAEAILADVLGCFGSSGAASVDAAVDAFFGFFRQSFCVHGDALPFLEVLGAAGIPAGILTDVPYGMPGRWVERDVAPFRPHVRSVLSSVEVGFRKPHGAGFFALAAALGAEPGEMAYVGDERKDIEGARAAGILAVLIDRTGSAEPMNEDVRVGNLMELAQLFLR